MSEEVSEIRKLLTPVRLQPLSLEVSPQAEDRRRKVVTRVQSLARQRANRQGGRRRRLWVLLAAAAGVCGVAPFILGRVSGSAGEARESIRIEVLSGNAVHATQGGQAVMTAGQHVEAEAGGQLSTMGGGLAHVTHPAGLSIDLAPQTVLAFPEAIEGSARRELRLTTGAVTLSVAKQPPGREVWVVTPDARVMVKGTVFSVSVRPTEQGPSTCVRVSQGVVAVQGNVSAATLGAGQRWGCDLPVSSLESSLSAGQPRPLPDPVSERAGRSAGWVESGPLAEQNRLLVEAIAAERRGGYAEAERKLEALLSRHPGSPLARDARVALERVRGVQGR